jgi:Skp family chaperone for outer membrane proteins
MLKDDLAANYDRTVEALVLARPTVAADGLKALVARREERLEALQTKVKALHARIVQSGRVDE